MRYGVWCQPKSGRDNGLWVGGTFDSFRSKKDAEDEATCKRRSFSSSLFEVREFPRENEQ